MDCNGLEPSYSFSQLLLTISDNPKPPYDG
nr:MAG TPA: hypothetical protein [Caudoviricetes sp.]